MDILKLMQERYTTKVYDSSFRLSDEQIDTLLEATRLSASSINSQPWLIRLASDAEKTELAQYSYYNADKVLAASHVVVLAVYRDKATFEKEGLPKIDPLAREYYERMLAPSDDAVVTKWLERQVYIALGTLLVAAASLGIDSTTMEGIEPESYARVLRMDSYRPLVAIALGKRSPEDYNSPHLKPKQRRTDVVVRG